MGPLMYPELAARGLELSTFANLRHSRKAQDGHLDSIITYRKIINFRTLYCTFLADFSRQIIYMAEVLK